MCGLLNIETPAKLDEVAGLVRGVNTPEDALAATLEAVSPAAREQGIVVGMSGAEALAIMRGPLPKL
jgi:uncharacterized protein YunC (DUF1805 family)